MLVNPHVRLIVVALSVDMQMETNVKLIAHALIAEVVTSVRMIMEIAFQIVFVVSIIRTVLIKVP
jgi:hypothetical protein